MRRAPFQNASKTTRWSACQKCKQRGTRAVNLASGKSFCEKTHSGELPERIFESSGWENVTILFVWATISLDTEYPRYSRHQTPRSTMLSIRNTCIDILGPINIRERKTTTATSTPPEVLFPESRTFVSRCPLLCSSGSKPLLLREILLTIQLCGQVNRLSRRPWYDEPPIPPLLYRQATSCHNQPQPKKPANDIGG